MIKAGQLNAMSLIDEIFHYVCFLFRKEENPNAFDELYNVLEKKLGQEKIYTLLLAFVEEFPPLPVYKGTMSRWRSFPVRRSAWSAPTVRGLAGADRRVGRLRRCARRPERTGADRRRDGAVGRLGSGFFPDLHESLGAFLGPLSSSSTSPSSSRCGPSN